MICRTCHHHQAEVDRSDCGRCAGLLLDLVHPILDSLRAAVLDRLSGPKATLAERSAQQISIKWEPIEAARAIKRSMAGATEAVITLPGVRLLLDAEIADLAKMLECSVVRGTEADTLLVVGFGEEEY